MRLPRMTTRRWMIAVAVVGVVLGAGLEYQRTDPWRRHCQYQANLLGMVAKEEFYWSDPKHIDEFEAAGLGPTDVARLRANLAHCREEARLHSKLRTKWLVGTWFPWIDIEPDPPEVVQADAVRRTMMQPASTIAGNPQDRSGQGPHRSGE